MRNVVASTEDPAPVRVGLVGVGKMGLSHLSIVRALSGVQIVGVCDSFGYLTDVLSKYTGLPTFAALPAMLDQAEVDALVIASPSGSHYELVAQALDRGIHVFCEKPLTLAAEQSADLARRAQSANLVSQVGYHYRYTATFAEVKQLLAQDVIGTVSHVSAQAYGPVVLREAGSTWRSKRTSGGGCLYDYAAHPLDLLQWYLGPAQRASGSILQRIFSAETDDAVYSTLYFADEVNAQLSVNWSDESARKMTTKIAIWGERGSIYADRQEIQVYLRAGATPPPGYRAGWTVRYITELAEPVEFYLRGEEYSAQLRAFVDAVAARDPRAVRSSFASAALTDAMIEMVLADSAGTSPGGATPSPRHQVASATLVHANDGKKDRRWPWRRR